MLGNHKMQGNGMTAAFREDLSVVNVAKSVDTSDSW